MKKETIILIIAMLLIVIMSGCTKSSNPAITPSVSTIEPANSATNIYLNSRINVNFNMAMDPASITNTTFTVKQGTNAVIGTVTCVGMEATFTPANMLGTNMVYTVTITTGVKNTTGTAILSNFTSSFTTGTSSGSGI